MPKYAEHTGHGCASEKLEQLLNDQLDAAEAGYEAEPEPVSFRAQHGIQPGTKLEILLQHPYADRIGPLFTQISALIVDKFAKTVSDITSEVWEARQAEDHQRYTESCGALQDMVKEARDVAKTLRKQNDELSASLSIATAAITDLSDDRSDMLRQVADLEEQLKQGGPNKAGKLAGEVQSLAGQLRERDETIASHQKAHVELMTILADRQERLDDQSRSIVEYQGQVKNLVEERANLGAEIVRLNQRLDEAFALIREQEKRLPGSAPAIEEITSCPEGGPGQCASPSAHPLLTDTWAVPRCLANRWAQANESGASKPAELCVSEHCERCNAYRREAGQPELVPNGWLQELTAGEAAALPQTREAMRRAGILPELAGRTQTQVEESPVVWFDPAVAPSEGDGAAEHAATDG